MKKHAAETDPWMVDHKHYGIRMGKHRLAIGCDEDMPIAEYWATLDIIAAAPEMVKALKKIISQLHDIEVDKTGPEKLCQRFAEEALKAAGEEI